MAIFRCDVASKELEMYTTVNVIIPNDIIKKSNLKVVYLLHGHSDNSSAWSRNTSIERYAQNYGVAVVMPEVQKSFYIDMEYGLKYFSYVSKELPKLVNQFFCLSTKRENNYIAGLSMGGYGAIKIGLSCPAKFAACAGFSGVLDIKERVRKNDDVEFGKELIGILGSELKVKPADDLFSLAAHLDKASKSEKPRVFVTCGTKDFLYEDNTKFRDFMNTLDFDFEYHEWEGEHTWDFWDTSIQMALEYFFKK